MRGAKEYYLNEITDGTPITYGVVQPGNEDSKGIPFIRSGDIIAGKIRLRQLRTITPEISNKYKRTILCSGDLLISLVGNPGEVAIVPIELEGANIARQVGLIRLNKDQADVIFIKYYFMAPHGKELLFSNIMGSVQQVINLKELKNIKIGLLPLPEQRAIAGVLSSLDNKIDLLHRQNKTLEGMAEALWRKMFVEEADTGWRKGKLGDVVKIIYGKNLPTSALTESGYPVFGANGQIGYYKEYLYSSPQVLISCRGEASGKVNFSCGFAFVTNNSLVLEIPINSILKYEFLKYWALASDFTLYVTGSAQPQITIEELKMAVFDMPSEEAISHFSAIVAIYEGKRSHNNKQIANLVKLRDTLLPKLMSGEVRVKL